MDETDKQDMSGAPKLDARKGGKSEESPQWADSLRNLYDSVVDEPIPDSFKDLLAQLDEKPNGSAESGGTP